MTPIVKAGTESAPCALELENRELARRVAAGGMVLLSNDGILPLTPCKVALFGSGARMTVKGGTGSGAVRERYSVTIEQGLEKAGYAVTTKDWLDRFDRFYADTYETYRQEEEERVKGVQNFYQILGMVRPFRHPTGMPVEDADISASGTDTAIFVISRQAGEGNDRANVPGDYQLDKVEYENLKKLSENYTNLIVVINVGGMIDLGFMDELHVSALVYCSQGGEEGGNALADLLSGTVNFSGRLTTSWPVSFSDVPSAETYSAAGEDPYTQEYREGIYVGYRYYDSFGVRPRYPFGYGLSYTAFEKKLTEITTDAEGVTVRTSVKNIGKVHGREVVLLFATVPFGERGAEFKRLAAYGKTSLLAPGASQTLELDIPWKSLAFYEERTASWILSAGDYVLRTEDRAEAVLRMKVSVTIEKCRNLCVPQYEIGEIMPPERPSEDFRELTVRDVDTAVIPCRVHEYIKPEEEIDPLVTAMTREQLAAFVCGGGTSNPDLQVMAMGASGCTTPDLYESLGIPNIVLSDGPAGLNLTSQIVELPDGKYKPAKVPQVLEAYKRYFFGMSKYALLGQMAAPEDGIMHYQFATAWPCTQLMAQSFNTELLELVGDAVGSEMDAYGVSIWLSPGMNIHRNPLCGRTFEYCSEDPVVSGKTAAALVRGVQKHPGKGTSIKHFAANSCELMRNDSSSDLTERTLREVYLRGFEIAVRESDPMTVMAAYNKINGTYCTNNYELLVEILRNEWGYRGMVMSDWDSMKADRTDCMKAVTGDVLKAHAAQCDLVMPGRPDQIEALTRGMESGDVSEEDLRRSATRILRIVRKNTILECRS